MADLLGYGVRGELHLWPPKTTLPGAVVFRTVACCQVADKWKAAAFALGPGLERLLFHPHLDVNHFANCQPIGSCIP